MANFDDLRRAAEGALGTDVVRQIEAEIARRSSSGRREVVDASKIRFERPSPPPDDSLSPRPEDMPSAGASAASVPAGAAQLVSSAPTTPARVGTTEGSRTSASERLLAKAVAGEYSYAKLGLSLGILCILGGLLLSLNGVAGATSWTAKFLGLESQINDAAPGVVLFIVGVFYVRLTKPRVKLHDLQG